MSEAWQEAYEARFANSEFGEDAIGLFALGLQFGLDDLDTLGADIVTGGSNDKKCDLIYLDVEEGRCVIAQCYISSKARPSAPANKASDLNTAISWLMNSQIEKLPIALRGSAADLRAAIKDGKLREIYVWYVHNLPESKNVAEEMTAVEHTANVAIRSISAKSGVRVLAREFGTKHFARLYRESGSPILVNKNIETKVQTGFRVSGQDWSAYQTFLPGRFFYDLYQKHGTDLFSANVRDYLGSRASDSNINNGIKETAESEPDHFWVFNNGVTALVNGLTSRTLKGSIRLSIQGISIVNGAQTTGAIGSLAKSPSRDMIVPVRFIWTKNEGLVEDIIKYNNSQNKISASDFRSTDPIQKRLKAEFIKIPDTEYEGGRRGGASDIIKRRPNLLPSYTVGQALAAFHGDPVLAYNRKSDIWVNDRNYSSYFKEETTAKHIVYVYSLYKAVGRKKLDLVTKTKGGDDLTKIEVEQLEFLEKKGAILLTCAAVADCLEIVLGRAIPNKFRLSFSEKMSPKNAEDLWLDLLQPLFALITTLDAAFQSNRVNTELAKRTIPSFRNVAAAVSEPNKGIFSRFAAKTKFD
ncbi:AIPR protein [Bradyrhizobium erythrophlei]|nr:AIPR protein [Bradyrhizobium erythrophlei]